MDGIQVHYKERGPATAPANPGAAPPAVLLIHGFNGSVFSWRSTMDPLADQVCVWGGGWGGGGVGVG